MILRSIMKITSIGPMTAPLEIDDDHAIEAEMLELTLGGDSPVSASQDIKNEASEHGQGDGILRLMEYVKRRESEKRRAKAPQNEKERAMVAYEKARDGYLELRGQNIKRKI